MTQRGIEVIGREALTSFMHILTQKSTGNSSFSNFHIFHLPSYNKNQGGKILALKEMSAYQHHHDIILSQNGFFCKTLKGTVK